MSHLNFDTFRALHAQAKPLLLPNAWDAASAVLFQNDGTQAIATSSAAMAWSLGYPDGSALPHAQLLQAVARIMRVARVPVSVDLEDGYSHNPSEVAELVLAMANLGVAGINIEDGVHAPELLAAKITACKNALSATPLFINARTDVYLKGMAQGGAAVAMAAGRINAYADAGADGAFVPGLGTASDTGALVALIKLPLNLMAVPKLAPIDTLFQAGARRFSAGSALFQSTYGYSRAKAQQFLNDSSIAGLFEHALPYAAMNQAMNAATAR